MLIDGKPVGIVSIHNSLIANLYVLPGEQNKGYGTQLLTFAIGKCTESPSLWVLSTNERAKKLYECNGFHPTGNIVQHADTDVYETGTSNPVGSGIPSFGSENSNCIRRT